MSVSGSRDHDVPLHAGTAAAGNASRRRVALRLSLRPASRKPPTERHRPAVENAFRHWISACAGITKTGPNATSRHSRASGNPVETLAKADSIPALCRDPHHDLARRPALCKLGQGLHSPLERIHGRDVGTQASFVVPVEQRPPRPHQDSGLTTQVGPPIEAHHGAVLHQQQVGGRLGDGAAREPDHEQAAFPIDAAQTIPRTPRPRPGRR